MKAAILMALLLASPAGAALTQRDLAHAVARPPAGATLPARLAFVDQHDARVTLADAAAGKPLVLLFVDYTCAHICGPGLTLTVGALHDSGLVAGRDYAIATIGIDAKDGVTDARAMAAARLGGLPDVARTIEMLTGDARTIAAAERALGYGVVYDAATDQFAHDAAVYVFAADGHLTSMLPELALRPETLRAAIAHPVAVPSFADRVVHLCYGFGAAHGMYARPAVLALQALAALLLAGMALMAWRWRRPA